jgi:hypothetical protein
MDVHPESIVKIDAREFPPRGVVGRARQLPVVRFIGTAGVLLPIVIISWNM